MWRWMVITLLFHANASPASGATAAEVWRSDLRLLARELPSRHPAPFIHVTRAQWDSATASLDRRIPSMSRNQRLVGFMQLVALVGDAHTVVETDSSFALRFYPLELYSFEDGLFVRSADGAHASWAGARVLRLGRVTAEEAMRRIATILPHENEGWVRAFGPLQLTIPEVIDGLGLAADVGRLSLVVERDGKTDTASIAPAGVIPNAHRNAPVPIDMSDWASMRTGPAPLWEQHPGEFFWWSFDAKTKTLYVCQRAVSPSPGSFDNRAQWNQVFAMADSVKPAQLVIDLRENLGGNGGLNRYPVQQILRRPWLDRRERLFVIIGRRTFSAGQQFTNLLEAWTQATLIGEPTGQRPSQYGDHRPLRLPGTGLTVQISSVFHQAPNEFDRRDFVAPRIYTPLDSKSYRGGIDPAMMAVMEPDTTNVMAAIEHAVAGNDTVTAERELTAARDKPSNRFRSFESETNALGYRLLAARKLEQALVVFRLNTRAYPGSANTFDSLGEALLSAGYREAAIDAYRKALALDPNFQSSAHALRGLGVH